jgi:hypothetical protein
MPSRQRPPMTVPLSCLGLHLLSLQLLLGLLCKSTLSWDCAERQNFYCYKNQNQHCQNHLAGRRDYNYDYLHQCHGLLYNYNTYHYFLHYHYSRRYETPRLSIPYLCFGLLQQLSVIRKCLLMLRNHRYVDVHRDRHWYYSKLSGLTALLILDRHFYRYFHNCHYHYHPDCLVHCHNWYNNNDYLKRSVGFRYCCPRLVLSQVYQCRH